MIKQFNAIQKKQWSEEGCVLLKGVLEKNEAKQILYNLDAVIKKFVAEDKTHKDSHSPFGVGAFKILRAIEKTKAFDCLIDHPTLFPLLLNLMGPYLQVMSTEIFIRNPNYNISEKFHTDAGPSMQRILPNETTPPLQFKVQFFLTDILEKDCGNFMYIPGSHRRFVSGPTEGCYIPEINCYLNEDKYPPETVQLIAEAGDVLIFPWALWHGVSKNTSNQVRRSITFRYGQLWCRPHDYISLKQDILERLTPRQRRLFGDLGEYAEFEPSDYYRPKDQLELMQGS